VEIGGREGGGETGPMWNYKSDSAITPGRGNLVV